MKQEIMSIVAADEAIMCYVQEKHVLTSKYLKRFNVLIDMTNSYGSSISHSRALVNAELTKLGVDHFTAIQAQKSTSVEIGQDE